MNIVFEELENDDTAYPLSVSLKIKGQPVQAEVSVIYAPVQQWHDYLSGKTNDAAFFGAVLKSWNISKPDGGILELSADNIRRVMNNRQFGLGLFKAYSAFFNGAGAKKLTRAVREWLCAPPERGSEHTEELRRLGLFFMAEQEEQRQRVRTIRVPSVYFRPLVMFSYIADQFIVSEHGVILRTDWTAAEKILILSGFEPEEIKKSFAALRIIERTVTGVLNERIQR